jgi:hypothetical protein
MIIHMTFNAHHRSCCNPCCKRPKCKCDECKCDDKQDDSAYLKFSGDDGLTLPLQTAFLADAGANAATAGPIEYPVARRGRLKNLAVNLAQAVLVPVNGLISVQLFKNGLAVPGFVVTWGPGETTGLKSVKTDTLKLSRDDLFSLQATFMNMQPVIDAFTVTATIGIKTN